jgi:hypothetical protein
MMNVDVHYCNLPNDMPINAARIRCSYGNVVEQTETQGTFGSVLQIRFVASASWPEMMPRWSNSAERISNLFVADEVNRFQHATSGTKGSCP